jgi:5-methylcytosine-specific restriction endonuclease McrA
MRRNYDAWYAALVEQYGERCQHCGTSADDDNLVVDHVVSIARGGKSEFGNLQLLCATCNAATGKLVYDCRA